MDFQGQISHQLTQTDDRGSMGSVQLANYNNNVNMNYNYGSGDIHNHIQTINNVFSAGMANEEVHLSRDLQFCLLLMRTLSGSNEGKNYRM